MREKLALSAEFRAWIRDLMKQKGLSVNALALLADVHQSAFNKGLLGDRNIPNETLEKIAPHLGVEPDRLTALADLDRMGGVERLAKHAPEVLTGGPSSTPRRKATSDTIAQVLAELPDDLEHPPTAWELKVLAKINGFDHSELDPRSGSHIWQYPPEARREELEQRLADWRDANEGGHAKAKGAG